jgi:hypothetical protein
MNPLPPAEGLPAVIAEAMYQVVHATQFGRARDAFMAQYWARKREDAVSPLVRRGAKFFSQNDEDGILLEILRRLGLTTGVFAELGVGNGLENNTLILLMLGWKGVWIGGEPLAFEVPAGGPLHFQQAWVARENCRDLVRRGLDALNAQRADVLMVDMDGNELHVLRELLAALHDPQVVVVEYNGKFPPPVRWTMPYNPEHVWDGTDYHGASLQSLADMLQEFGYRLVACNITGTNAFFIKVADTAKFSDVPPDVGALFMKAEHIVLHPGHETSPKTIASFLAASKPQTKP